jgi:hypothetical protein
LNYITEGALESTGESVEGHLLIRHHCLFLQTPGGPVDVAWPAGYSASAEAGTVVLRDVDDNEVARVGDWVRLDVGGETSSAGLECGVGVGAALASPPTSRSGTRRWGGRVSRTSLSPSASPSFAGYPQTGSCASLPVMEVGVGRAVVERLVGDEVLERDAWWLEVKPCAQPGRDSSLRLVVC